MLDLKVTILNLEISQTFRQDPGLCKLASGSFTPLYPPAPSPPNMLKIQDWMISYFQDLEFKQWLCYYVTKCSVKNLAKAPKIKIKLFSRQVKN